MSAIASLYLLDQSSIPELARLARASVEAPPARLRVLSSSRRPTISPTPFYDVLIEHGRQVREEYDWSGYCMLYLLTYLDKCGVRLRKSEFDAESNVINKVYDYTVLITSSHKTVLDQLDPAGHSEHELVAHFEEMGFGFEEAGMAALDGLKLLHDNVSRLRDDEVLLLHIG